MSSTITRARRATALPVPKAHQARREDIEAFLSEKAVLWTFRPEVPVSEFDLDKSLRNQARINTVLNEPQVETYVEAMKRGDIFPGILAYKDGGKMIAIDGNHRLHASKISGKTVPTYVIDPKTDPKTIVLMTYEANAKHGLPNSVDERLRHAVYMVKNGTTQEVAAARLNVTLASLKRAFSKAKADDRAEEAGLIRSKWESLAINSRTRLGSISSDEIFTKACDLAFRAKMDTPEIDSLVGALNKERSTVRQSAYLDDQVAVYRTRIQANGAGAYTKRSKYNAQSPKQQVFIATGFINNAAMKEKVLLEVLAPQEEADFIVRCEKAAIELLGIVEAIKARQKKP